MGNYLKQTISYKEVHVMDEFLIIDELKKKCLEIKSTPDDIQNNDQIEYLLPNFINRFEGRVIEGEADKRKILKDDACAQMIKLGNERFLGGEILFNPNSIIGLECLGITEILNETLR